MGSIWKTLKEEYGDNKPESVEEAWHTLMDIVVFHLGLKRTLEVGQRGSLFRLGNEGNHLAILLTDKLDGLAVLAHAALEDDLLVPINTWSATVTQPPKLREWSYDE